MRCLRHTHLGKLSFILSLNNTAAWVLKIPSFQCEYSTAALMSDHRGCNTIGPKLEYVMTSCHDDPF